ncbi:DUF2935 domain-containing protein [Desulfitobacterium metallireducens]|uniref:DUF2935 domain-containing protein n=1 Tax=Desulfitobacterium metallireducens DSM 15288 TaxID=871968 RepID=W0E9X0_9FIRM|nr:DUF2935 domain-containing protein [Desulfitobacterium metallireducens]AHF06313.1 hypothetical protein DESME_03990 [Desulfitobacterium metallireducens DSM 15288]
MSTMPITGDFVRESLELHLFWARIMKEHAIFDEDGFECKDVALIQEAENYKCQFEEVLYEAICLAQGRVDAEVLQSGELFTDKTLMAEQKTMELSGIEINMQLTVEEMNLQPGMMSGMVSVGPEIVESICALNAKALACAQAMSGFLHRVYEDVTKRCCLFTHTLPSIFHHQLDETKLYIKQILRLQSGQMVDPTFYCVEMMMFWNSHMKEHAEVIRQLLDPSENLLIEKANSYAKEFAKLEKKFEDGTQPKASLKQITRESYEATLSFKDFKAAATEMILACQVKSTISALLGDHVLREAYHYLRILGMPLPEFKGGRG